MKKISRLERLAKKDERQIIRRIFTLSVFSIILAIFIFTLGIPLLGNLADTFETIFKKGQDKAAESQTLVSPTLDPLPEATNSAEVTIGGISTTGILVAIYRDDEKVGTADVKDGRFLFEKLTLKNGENKIMAKSVGSQDQESDFSEQIIITLDKEEPRLEVETPSDGQSFSQNNRIRVAGLTDNDAQVYANGFLAYVASEGKFEVYVPVAEGETTIEVKAIDEAGNTKVESRKVSFKK